ncbi:MAG: AAA family ATPase, partial [Firmicutes bacterium]|nr:AAA family ATPase [Bacillota bacterium]
MRIRRLHAEGLASRGPVELEFASRSPDLHVVFGPNEAGKSTVRQLLFDALYGIESAKEMPALYGQE